MFVRKLMIILCLPTILISKQLLNRPERANLNAYPVDKDLSTLRIITYNIRWNPKLDQVHKNSWDIRKPKIVKLLTYYKPDIIGLQEIHDYYMPDLANLLPNYESIYFDILIEHDHVSYKGHALLYNIQRFILLEKNYFFLSPEPYKESTIPAWNCKSVRFTIKARLFDTYTNQEFIVFVTHFDSFQPQARFYSAQLLAQQAALLQLPLIVLGDLNLYDETGQEAYEQLFTNDQLKDIRDLTEEKNHFGPDGTWIGWPYDPATVKPGTVGKRLDHILVKNFKVCKEGVLNDKITHDGKLLFQAMDKDHTMNIHTLHPSDHLPVIADITL